MFHFNGFRRGFDGGRFRFLGLAGGVGGTLPTLLLATPRSQYWRNSEQTLATSYRSRPVVPAGSDWLAIFTFARAVSAVSWLSSLLIRWPLSSKSGIRFFVPGRV